jgi:hypothetical protein
MTRPSKTFDLISKVIRSTVAIPFHIASELLWAGHRVFKAIVDSLVE